MYRVALGEPSRGPKFLMTRSDALTVLGSVRFRVFQNSVLDPKP